MYVHAKLLCTYVHTYVAIDNLSLTSNQMFTLEILITHVYIYISFNQPFRNIFTSADSYKPVIVMFKDEVPASDVTTQ